MKEIGLIEETCVCTSQTTAAKALLSMIRVHNSDVIFSVHF